MEHPANCAYHLENHAATVLQLGGLYTGTSPLKITFSTDDQNDGSVVHYTAISSDFFSIRVIS